MNVTLIESREDRLLLSISNLFPRLQADTYHEHVEKKNLVGEEEII